MSCQKEDPAPAAGNLLVTTGEATTVTSTSASVAVTVQANPGTVIEAKGVCWGLTQSPTVANSKTDEGSGASGFVSALTGLTANTTYFVRAYVTDDSNTTTYGNQVTFKTQAPFGITLTTAAVTAITSSGATSGGSMVTSGSGTITAKGVVWSKTQNPTIADASTSNGTGTGSFTSAMAGLQANTFYYVRAYATDSDNQTVYGNQVSFKTLNSSVMINTDPVVMFTSTTASVSGIVTVLDPMVSISVAGLCWDTSASPTLANNKTQEVFNLPPGGPVAGTMTGLTAGTKYYVRIYATDNTGQTTYGNVQSFTTPGGTGSTEASLDGKWKRSSDNNVVVINTSAGTGVWDLATFTPTAEYMVMVSNGQATLSTPHLKNIVKTSSTTWTCQRFTFTFQGSGSSATITNVNYIPGTITMAPDGKSFTLVATVSSGLGYPSNWVGQTLTSTWTKQ